MQSHFDVLLFHAGELGFNLHVPLGLDDLDAREADGIRCVYEPEDFR